MNIALDTRWIFREISGIGMYTRELLQALLGRDRENQYVLLFNDPVVREQVMGLDAVRQAGNARAVDVPWGLFQPAGQWGMGRVLRRESIDLYHSTNYMIPLPAFPAGRPGRIRCAITIHDLIPLIFPDHAPQSKKARFYPLFKWILRQAARRTDLVITVSESSRQDIIERLGLPEREHAKVVVTPEGVGNQYRPGDPVQRQPNTLLYVGRFDPYKNVTGLVEAFARTVKEVPTAHLRIIGPPDPRYPEPRERARALGIDDHITWQGYVESDELVRAYQQTAAMVLPSTYEGFGLTVLEAMACATPVICSNVSSLPEVAGDAALLVDPKDPAALAGAMTSVLTDPVTADRLREQGLARAAGFTWTRCAEATLAAYRQAAGH